MSLVKRADGITYIDGHYTSRGTLGQVKYGSMEEKTTPQEEHWLKQITAALMSVEDSLLLKDYALDDWADTSDEISKIWGIYYNTCPHIRRKFNEDYFWPDY